MITWCCWWTGLSMGTPWCGCCVLSIDHAWHCMSPIPTPVHHTAETTSWKFIQHIQYFIISGESSNTSLCLGSSHHHHGTCASVLSPGSLSPYSIWLRGYGSCLHPLPACLGMITHSQVRRLVYDFSMQTCFWPINWVLGICFICLPNTVNRSGITLLVVVKKKVCGKFRFSCPLMYSCTCFACVRKQFCGSNRTSINSSISYYM